MRVALRSDDVPGLSPMVTTPAVAIRIAAALEVCGLAVIDETGMIYELLADRWRLSSDMDVNYMMIAQKPSDV